MATASVVDRAVPGAGPLGDVLSTVLQLCGEMKEAKCACTSLHARLKGVLDELQTMEESGQIPQKESIDKLVRIVTNFLLLLERRRETSLVFRLVESDTIVEELQHVSDDIAELFEELGAVTVNWDEQWDHDTKIHKDVLVASAKNCSTVLRDLPDPRAHVEAALVLKFAMQQQAAEEEEEIMEGMKSMLANIAAYSKANVNELPPWFIPPYAVQLDSTPFARGSFGSVHRRVWGRGPNVVVKRLFCDDMVNDERMRLQVERELSLLHKLSHPNVIKMLGGSHVSSPPFVVSENATAGNLGGVPRSR